MQIAALKGKIGDAGLCHREQPPLPRRALQLMHAALGELQAGADHQLLDRARDADFAGGGQGADAGADVHGHAGDVVVDELDLAGVDAGADGEGGEGVADGGGAADGAGGAVEGGEEAVAHGLDLAAAVDGEEAGTVVSWRWMRSR